MTGAGNGARFAARPLSAGGTSADTWSTRARRFPELDLAGCRSLIVVAPHPDDETLGFGASAAALQTRGISVQVVAVTDGEACYEGPLGQQREELGSIRRAELHTATEILGLPPPIFLAVPDGEISCHTAELRDVLTTLLADTPGAWCAATWRGDGHPDHEAVGAAAAAAVDGTGGRLLEYPVWMWHWGTPDDEAVPWERACRISTDQTAVDRKWLAAAAFRSQLEPHPSGEPVVPPFAVARLRAVGEMVFT